MRRWDMKGTKAEEGAWGREETDQKVEVRQEGNRRRVKGKEVEKMGRKR